MISRDRPLTASLMALLLVGLAGCSAGSQDTPLEPITQPSLAPVGVDTDTAELRRMKERARIETCVPGSSAEGVGELPQVTLPCLGGGPAVDLSTLRGPLVVNVWGSWCAPCRDELPILADFYAQHGDRVAMLGIDFQDTRPADALRLAEQSGVTYPQLFDHDGVIVRTSMMPGPAVPALAFVDAAGAVSGWVPGEVKSEQQLRDLVNRYLGVDL